MRSYAGKGILNFPGISAIKGSFKLTFHEDGKVTLVFFPEGCVPNQVLNFNVDSGRFSGDSANSDYHVEIDKIYLNKIHLGGVGDTRIELLIFHPVKIGYLTLQNNDRIELIRGFSNLLFWGTEITKRDDTFSKDTIKVTLDGREARLVQFQDFEQISEHLKECRDVRVTSEFKVEGDYRELDHLRELSESVQFLCSLASGNYVTALYEDIYNKDDVLCETTLYPLKTYPFSVQNPLIDTSLHGVKDFKDYLECAYPLYEQFKTPLRLPYVIELFITSKIYSPIELQYLLTTTSLECLERHLKTWKNLPPLKGINTKTQRLLDFFKVPYNKSEAAFNHIRNSIVHEGRFPQSVDGFKSLMELRNLLDRLFLVILGYKGKHYYNVVSRKKELL